MMGDLIDAVIQREGGFSDHPNDRGQSTRWGITQQRLSEWRGQPASRDDVFDLTKEEAREIYAAWYVAPIARIKHRGRLFELVFDIGVMSGPETAIKMLQHEINAFGVEPLLVEDGILGPKTAAAVEELPEASVRQALVVARVPALVRLVEGNPTQLVFLEGWVIRTLAFLPEAGA